jgi:hypothetical protein
MHSNQLLPLEAHVVISNDIVVRENKDGTVIAMKMDDSDLFYKIDGAAAEIFKDLRKNIDLKTSVENVSKKHGVNIPTVHNDVSAFLKKLLDLGFISLE